MKYGKKIRQHMGASEIFRETDWIQYKELKILIKNSVNPGDFKAALSTMISHSEDIFVATLGEESEELAKSFMSNRKKELKTFAKSNREACRKIVKKYKKKLGQSIDITRELDQTTFRFYAQSPLLSANAQPFSPSKLIGNIPEFTLSTDIPESTLSADTPSWTPALNVDAPVWTPTLNSFAEEFVPLSSSKPETKNLSFGITESGVNYDATLDLGLPRTHPLQRESHPLEVREAHPLQASVGQPVFFQTEENICNVEERTYGLDWLLSKRLDQDHCGPAPDMPSGITFPIHSREALWSETTYKGPEIVEDSFFDIGSLARFVTPTFFDELPLEDRNDPINRVYGSNFLQSAQPYFCDVHPDLLDKPELLSSTTMNNMVCQFMASGLMTPFLQQTFGAVPETFVGMPGMGSNMNPMLQMQNLLSAMMNIAGPPGQFPAHASDKTDIVEKKASSPKPLSPKKKEKVRSGSSTPDRVDEPLHKATKPWSRCAVVLQEEDLAARTMQSILNKLVPEKFDRLLAQAISKIDVTKQQTLVALANSLHKKAISEADYAPIYTHFVRKLRNSEFKSFIVNGENVNIETSLRDLCLARLNGQPEWDMEDEEIDLKKRVYWKETLGNYTLLAELYKREVIGHEYVVGIMRMLVAIVANVECDMSERSHRAEEMFHLLKSCGTEFEEKCKQLNYMATDMTQNDDNLGPHFLDIQFEVLASLDNDSTLTPRVRFMLQDLVDLKNKHWEITNKTGMDPKFLREIREEIRKEKVHKQQHLHSLRRITRKENSKREKRSRRTKDTRTRVRRRIGKKSKSETDVTTLVPVRRPKIHKIRWTKIVQGCLDDDNEPKSCPVNSLPPKSKKNPWATGPPKNLVQDFVEEDVASVHSSVSSDLTTPTSASSTASTNEEQREREMDTLLIETNLLEYFETNEMEKCQACFAEVLGQGASAKQLLETLMNIAIERSERNREQFALLLVFLAQKDTLSPEQFKEGFEGVDEFLDDWRLDVPMLPSYIASWIRKLQAASFDLHKTLDMKSKSWDSVLEKLDNVQSALVETCI